MERDDLKCDNCPSSMPDYFLKHGKDYMVLCKDCLADILIEECNEAYEIDGIEEEELEEILKEIDEKADKD